MSDYGIKIARPGKDTSSTDPKDYVILSSEENHKLLYKGWVTGGSYTHNLGKLPVFYVFEADGTANPTYFTRSNTNGEPGTANITGLPGTCYLIVFREGV